MQELLPWLIPKFHQIAEWIVISQTLITSFFATLFFLIVALIYKFIKNKNDQNLFVNSVDMIIEGLVDFFEDISWKTLSKKVIVPIVFLFFYISWVNIFWAFWDLFALSIPTLHEYFRPIASDAIFNFILAIFFVLWAIAYGFYKHWFKFIKKYVPINWIWLIDEVNWVGSFFVKVADIIIALFVGLLEFIWELAKVISLSLRLFWNILAWAVLFVLIFAASQLVFKIAILLPLVVLVMELFVWVLQAFIFTLLVLVYFKMAETGH